MKKSLLALAVLGAFAGAASAQSSVTLFGVVDLSVNYQKSNGVRAVTLDSNQLNSNRLGFKGIEDLGGGLKAGFWLEAGMNNDTGTGAAGGGGLSFNRRSTVSLIGNFGEIRLGRDYTPTFWNTVLYDVYGANGIGEGVNLTNYGPAQTALHSGAVSTVRANNSVAYWLPASAGGFYGRAQVGAGEGVVGQKYYGGSLNWAGAGADVGVGYGIAKIPFNAGTNPNSSDYKVFNVGGSYDFGVVKIYGLFNQAKYNPVQLKTYELSAGIPIGVGAINASFTHAVYSGTPLVAGNDVGSANQYGLQYLYNVSKRTALYTSVARITNKDGAAFAFGDVAVGASKNVNGANVGVRHSF